MPEGSRSEENGDCRPAAASPFDTQAYGDGMSIARLWQMPEAELPILIEKLAQAQGLIDDAALAFAQLGVPIFPCTPEKKPYIDGGFRAASVDRQHVDRWWQRWPQAMIGMPTGNASGVLAIDIDAAGEAEAHEQLARQCDRIGGTLPACPVVLTPRGGMHLWFAWDETTPLGNRTNILKGSREAKGIDVRGEGGYVILPPSRRRDGGKYCWADDCWLGDIRPPKLPLALADLILRRDRRDGEPRSSAAASAARFSDTAADRERRYAFTVFNDEIRKVETAGKGERNDTLNIAAFSLGQFVAAGALSKAMVRSALESAASICGLIEEDAGAVRATIVSGLKAGMAKPRDLSSVTKAEPKAASGGHSGSGVEHG